MAEMKATVLPYWEEDEQTDLGSLVSLRLLTRNTRLVEARRAKGVTQVQMAHDIGMSQLRLSNIENLKFVPSSPDQAEIVAYLEQPCESLFPDILMEAIEEGVFSRRDAQLTKPQIISLTEAARLQLTYDGETEIIDEVDRHLLRERIDEALSTLSPREAKVLRLRFGLGDRQSQTLEQVARWFDLTRERIRQIESKALRKLRHPSTTRRLRDFLE